MVVVVVVDAVVSTPGAAPSVVEDPPLPAARERVGWPPDPHAASTPMATTVSTATNTLRPTALRTLPTNDRYHGRAMYLCGPRRLCVGGFLVEAPTKQRRPRCSDSSDSFGTAGTAARG